MTARAVSPEYPDTPYAFTQDEIRSMDLQDLSRENVVEYLIEADCWGIAIRRKNGRIEPKINTYALWKKIGKSFGTERLPNKQYDFEHIYRESLYEDGFEKLLNELDDRDSLLIYMFGNWHPPSPCAWRVTMTKEDHSYTFSVHKKYKEYDF